MAERDEHIDYELITRYLAGETLPDEQAMVNAWLNATEENRQSFFRLKRLWEQTGRIIPREEADVNVDRGWTKFRERIHEGPHSENVVKPEPKTRSLFFYISRIAAVLVLGFGFYFVINNLTDPNKKSTVLSAANETTTDTLSDGSVISLNAKSQITYSGNFSDYRRSLSLKGEAFFEVKHNPQKPFMVETKEVLVTVLGTSFYVNNYDSLEEIKIGVEEGRVQIDIKNTDKKLVLEKGESLTINRNTTEISTHTYEPNEVYWKSKTLIFQNKQLSEVFRTLEKIYQVEIEVENKQILECRLTAKFSDENIKEIFEIINTNFNLTSLHEDQTFLISGNGCGQQ